MDAFTGTLKRRPTSILMIGSIANVSTITSTCTTCNIHITQNAKFCTLTISGNRLLAGNCHFDTSARPANSMVQIGEEKGMCLQILLYYPKQDISTTSYTCVPTNSLFSSRFINDMEWCSQPPSGDGFGSLLCGEKLCTGAPEFSLAFAHLEYDGPSFDYVSYYHGCFIASVWRTDKL